jgi:hypothetical protein
MQMYMYNHVKEIVQSCQGNTYQPGHNVSFVVQSTFFCPFLFIQLDLELPGAVLYKFTTAYY